MVGLSTAWFLQREGVEVTVVDKHDVAAGASWGNAGWLAPALTLPLPEPAILATGIRAALSPSSPVYVPLTANPRLLRFLVGFARHCTDKHWRRAMSVFNQANAVALDAYADLAAAPGDVAVSRPDQAGHALPRGLRLRGRPRGAGRGVPPRQRGRRLDRLHPARPRRRARPGADARRRCAAAA